MHSPHYQLTPKFMADQKWEDWDKQSWEELVSRGSSVLLSDQHEFTGNLQLPKVPDLPPYMLHDPNRDLSKPQFYAPGGAGQH